MFRAYSSENKFFSKDAHKTAPSSFCAHTHALTLNTIVITGIAVAVSVFLLISMIYYGIMIHNIIIMPVIIMSIIIFSVYIIKGQQKNLNIQAKLHKASI